MMAGPRKMMLNSWPKRHGILHDVVWAVKERIGWMDWQALGLRIADAGQKRASLHVRDSGLQEERDKDVWRHSLW